MTSVARSSRTRAIVLLAALLAAAITFLGGTPPAHAADPVPVARLDAILPADTAAVWFAAENGGADAGGLTLIVKRGSTAATANPVAATTFGAGAVLTATPGALTVYVASRTAATPDVSLTAVDADGRILRVFGARVTLTANAATDVPTLTGEATPIDVVTTEPPASSVAVTGGTPAITGGTIAWGAGIVALLLIAGGTALVLHRRRTRTAAEEVAR